MRTIITRANGLGGATLVGPLMPQHGVLADDSLKRQRAIRAIVPPRGRL